MTQYNTLHVKLYNSQLNLLNSGIKNFTEVTLNLSSNAIGHSNDNFNFPNKLLLTDKQVLMLCKAFVRNSAANIKLSKTQISKIVQLEGFLGRLFGQLLQSGLPLIKRRVLIPLGVTAAVSTADAGIYKKS